MYTAQHPTLKRKIILKRLTIRDKEFKERFRREADLMMDLRSDYIVDMYDHFREGNSWYIAMEYIEGITLEELVQRQGELDLPVIAYIMICTARALEYIHERGIVHRDIKPANIYISKDGDVKLGDFGIAASDQRNVKITDSGSAMGTPAYMAPEQFDDSSSVGFKADLFSLGVTIYETLCGVKPFRSESYSALKNEIQKGRYSFTPLNKRGVPTGIKLLIRRSLFVRTFLRPRSVSSVKKQLERWLGRNAEKTVRTELADRIKTGNQSKKTAILTKLPGPSLKKKKSIFKPLLLLSIFVFFTCAIGGFFLIPRYGFLEIRVLPAETNSRYRIFPYNSEDFREGLFNEQGEKTLFLKEGSFRIRVESGSSVSWRSVYVSSLYNAKDKRRVTVLSAPLEGLPLTLDWSVKDRFSGEELTDHSSVYIRKDQKWEELEMNELKTGTTIDLKFTCTGYRDEIFNLNPAFHQTLLDLDVLLTAEPARIVLSLSGNEEFLINGSKKYFSPDSLKFENLYSNGGNKQTLNLVPGTYRFILRSEFGTVDRQMDLYSGKTYNFP